MAISTSIGGRTQGSPASFSYPSAQAVTVMAWILVEDATTWTSRRSIAGVYAGPISAPSAAAQLGVHSFNTFGVWTSGGPLLVGASGHGTPIGVWNHYCYVYNGAGTNLLYINGELNNTNTLTQNTSTFEYVYLNGYPNGVDGNAETGNTRIDDFAVFSRQLTQDEIRTIINCRGSRDGIFPGLLARFPFNEGALAATASPLFDLSVSRADMVTLSPSGAFPVFTTPHVMSNLRQVQG